MQAKEQKRENKIFQILAWALLGAVLTYIVCAVSLTGDHTLHGPFYNCGVVTEIQTSQFRRDIEQETGHQEASGKIVLDQGLFQYTASVHKYYEEWQYLCVQIENLTTDSIEWQIVYEYVKDEEVTESFTQSYVVSEGDNYLLLPDSPFTQATIFMSGEEGCSFSITSMQFRENIPAFRAARAAVAIILTALCYVTISVLVVFLYRKSDHKGRIRPYVCIELLQEFYLLFIRRVETVQSKRSVNDTRRRIFRASLFLFMLCYNLWVNMMGSYSSFFKYHILIYAVIFLTLAVLSVEGNTSRKNWNNPLVWGWLLSCVGMCVSDFVLKKASNQPQFAGYAMILILGFFIFVWNNMENRGEIMEDFVRAIHAFFWIITVYCVLFKPDNGISRYAGFALNVNTFGVCLAVFWAVVLGSLEHVLRTHRKKKFLFLYIIEGCVVLSFAWKTQTTTALISIGIVTLVWLVRMCVYAFRHGIKKILVGTILCAALLFLPVWGVLSLGLRYVPEKLGTAVAYEDDVSSERVILATEVYAADTDGPLMNSRLFQKLRSADMDTLLSGRNYIYKEYFRNLNLFGHERYAYVSTLGHRYSAHNEVLGTAYYYGIFTVIPNLVMLLAALVLTWRFARKKISYAGVPFFSILAYVVLSMGDNVDAPFNRFPWFVVFILMGCVFCETDDSKEFLEKAESGENKSQAIEINCFSEDE